MTPQANNNNRKKKALVYVESKRISDKNSARLCCTARRRVCLVAWDKGQKKIPQSSFFWGILGFELCHHSSCFPLLQQQQQGVRHTSELPFRDFHHQDQILLTQRGEEVDHHLQLQHTLFFRCCKIGLWNSFGFEILGKQKSLLLQQSFHLFFFFFFKFRSATVQIGNVPWRSSSKNKMNSWFTTLLLLMAKFKAPTVQIGNVPWSSPK